MLRRTSVVATGAAWFALGLAACGGSSSSGSSAPATSTSNDAATSSSAASAASAAGARATTLTNSADPSGELKFEKSSMNAKAGKITIEFTNTSSVPHNLAIVNLATLAVVATTPTFSGGTQSVTVTLKPGRYGFVCTVPGHAEGGMQGTLTVT